MIFDVALETAEKIAQAWPSVKRNRFGIWERLWWALVEP